jgi:hypothetical protein
MRQRMSAVLRSGSLGGVLVTIAGCATLTAPQPGSPATSSRSSLLAAVLPDPVAGHPDGRPRPDRRVRHQHLGVHGAKGPRPRQRVRSLCAAGWAADRLAPERDQSWRASILRCLGAAGAATYDVSIFSWSWVQVGMNVDMP